MNSPLLSGHRLPSWRNLDHGQNFKSPSVSFSQLRLHELTEEFESEKLAVPNYVETRSGYFDPIYTKKQHSQQLAISKRIAAEDLDGVSLELSRLTRNNKAKQAAQGVANCVFSFFHRARNAKYYIPSHIPKAEGIFKVCAVYIVTIILCLNATTGRWLGRYRAIMPLTMLIQHPGHTFGTQLEMSILAELGALAGIAVAVLSVYLSTITGSTRDHYGGIFACFIFVVILVLQMVRLSYARSYYFCVNMGNVLLYSLLSFSPEQYGNLNYLHYFKNFIIPVSIANLLTLAGSWMLFPQFSHKKLITAIVKALSDIKLAILITVNNRPASSDSEETAFANGLIPKSINWTQVMLSEAFREFANEIFKFTLFEEADLVNIRNCINFIISPLKSIPHPIKLPSIQQVKIRKYINNSIFDDNSSKKSEKKEPGSSLHLHNLSSAGVFQGPSGAATPRPASQKPQTPLGFSSSDIYFKVVEKYFSTPIIELLSCMVSCIEVSQVCLIKFGRLSISTQELIDIYGFDSQNKYFEIILSSEPKDAHQLLLIKLEDVTNKLKHSLWLLDVSYKKFAKTEWFCNDLLSDRELMNIFLFLRYHRQTSKLLLATSSIILKMCSKLMSSKKRLSSLFLGQWKLIWISYPFKKAVRRLPKQCLKDRGKLAIFNYFQVRQEVEKSFEKIYNINTSRNLDEKLKDPEEMEKHEGEIIRAINHADYNKHLFLNTKTRFKYNLWRSVRVLSGSAAKNSFKHSSLIIFTALPSLLNDRWYVANHCYWCPILIWLLFSSTGVFSFDKIFKRVGTIIMSAFWAWCCCQAVLNHHKNIYLMAIFVVIFSIPSIIKYYCFPSKTRAGFVALVTFSVVVVETYADSVYGGNSATTTEHIWNNTWSIALLMIIAVLLALFVNILIWPFIARNQVSESFAGLLLNLSQCYQIVNDRYVYRDTDDVPTELTLTLSTIREIRVLQHLYAVKNVLEASMWEANIINISANVNRYYHRSSKLYFNTISRLLDSCGVILEKVVEARINAIQFNSWIKDGDYAVSKKLIPLRRDSVASIIFNFYLVANCFASERPIPAYLPNLLSIRRQLYDELSVLQSGRDDAKNKNKKKDAEKDKQAAAMLLPEDIPSLEKRIKNLHKHTRADRSAAYAAEYEEVHWTEIHAIAFSMSVTDLIRELEKVIEYSKIILGEEQQ